MPKKDEFFEKAFKVLEQEGMPTVREKDRMLQSILTECKAENTSGIDKLKKMIVSYPWRFAFSVSAIQSIVCTMIFGTRYTNLLLSIFGG